MSGRWRIILRSGLAVLLLTPTLLAIVFGLAASDWGRARVADLANRVLADVGGFRISLAGIEEISLHRLRIGMIRIDEGERPLARLLRLDARWNLRELLFGPVRLEHVGIGTVAVLGLPEGEDDGGIAGPLALPRPPLLPVRAVVIERLEVRPPVVEREMIYRLDATEMAGQRGEWTLALNLLPVETAADRLRLEVKLHPDTDHLALMLELKEAKGGLLARLAGLPQAHGLSAGLAGEGTASDWRGRLAGEAGGLFRVETDIGLSLVAAPRMTLNGRTFLLGDIPKELAEILGPRIDHEGELVWRDRRLEVPRLIVGARTFDLGIQGSLAPDAQTIDMKGQARLLDLGASLAVHRPGLSGALDIDFTLEGALLRPAARARIQGWSLDRESGIGGEVDMDLTLSATRALTSGDGHEIALEASLRQVQGLPPALGVLVGDELRLRALLQTDAGFETLALPRLGIVTSGLSAEGDGLLDRRSGQLAMGLKATVPELSRLNRTTGMTARGRADVRINLAGTLTPLALDLDLEVDLGEFAPAEPTLAALAGKSPALRARGRFDEAAGLTIERLGADLAEATLSGSGSVDAAGIARLSARIDLPRLNSLPALAEQQVSGAATMELAIAGPLEAPRVDAVLTGRDLDIRGASIERPRLRTRVQGPFDRATAEIDLDASVQGLPLALAASARRDDGGDMVFRLAQASLAALRVSGQGRTALADGLTDGKFLLEMPAGQWLPLPGGQALAGELRLEVELMRDATRQRANALLAGRALALRMVDGATTRLGRIELTASATDLLRQPEGRIEAALTEFQTGEIGIDEAAVLVAGTLREMDFRIETLGAAGEPFAAQLAGAGSLAENTLTLRLSSLSGSFGKLEARLEQPTTVEIAPGSQRLARTDLAVAGGRLAIEGAISPDQVSARAELTDLPMAVLADLLGLPEMSGAGHLSLRIDGSPRAPGATADLRLAALRARNDMPPLEIVVRSMLANGRLDADGRVEGLADRPLELDFAIPLRLSLLPYDAGLVREAAVRGRLRGPLDLALLSPLLAPGEDRLTGRAEADLALQGSLERPRFFGRLRLREGTYESIVTASSLSNITLDLTGDGESLRASASAEDGTGGRLNLEGSLDPHRPGMPLSLMLRTEEFWLARRDDALVKAAADLTLAGDLERLRLAGELRVLQADISVPERLPPSVATVEVIEINRPGRMGQADAGRSVAPPLALEFAVGVKAQNRVFVRGRGLESEWGGDLALTGTAAQPAVTGRLGVVRGHVDLLGKRFVLQRGTIQFPGGSTIDPLIDALAEVAGRDVTAILSITGSVEEPQIAISSRPELPQDEILARVMFGRGTGQLTPLQALQVADSAATLTGRGGGTGVLGRLRQAVGLDMLDVQSGEEGVQDARVSAGKYLTEDVLLKVEQGLTAASSRVGVEVELTPNISLETKVGPDATSEVGVNFKIDY
ncbi:MAG: translocation/assembly module TamB domain-containing protein [Alphaproteobacteria bacterium]|nr:translocation/assembly module TamB domain-containing protein [Alphaproteobacteria bacterium]